MALAQLSVLLKRASLRARVIPFELTRRYDASISTALARQEAARLQLYFQPVYINIQ